MKKKKGICRCCPPERGEQYLYSKGLCQSHYWQENAKKNAEKNKEKNAWKEEKRKELNIFFASQILEVPRCCEECGADLTYWKNSKLWKAIIAHILAKRENAFPRFALHPKNRMFYCPDCHTNFDNGDSNHAKQMKSLPLMRERFNEFKPLLTESELARVPEYLK